MNDFKISDSDVTGMSRKNTKVLVLGVGNVMMGDEGLGVHVVRRLMAEFIFPPAVEVVDGGTSGLALLPVIRRCQQALIVDAIEANAKPGSIFMFNAEEIDEPSTAKLTLHDISILEVLKTAALLGDRPPATIIGVQPGKMDEFGRGLSQAVKSKVPRVMEIVIKILAAEGLDARRQWIYSPSMPASGTCTNMQ